MGVNELVNTKTEQRIRVEVDDLLRLRSDCTGTNRRGGGGALPADAGQVPV